MLTMEQKAAAFDWLMEGKRSDYIWNFVLSDEDRDLPADHMEEIIVLAVKRDTQ